MKKIKHNNTDHYFSPLINIKTVNIPGTTGHQMRQYFPYVSSESDLQRYKAISFRQNVTNNETTRASSSLSNVPSDMKSDRMKVDFSFILN